MFDNSDDKKDDRKPFLSKVINPITPIDQEILRDIRKAVSDGDEEFDPIEDAATSSELVAIPRQTSGSMGIIPPHTTQYIIRSKDFDIFAEMQGALCKHIRLGRFPGPMVLARPPYEKLVWDRLTTKPFNGKYPFIIDRMTKPFELDVYLDSHFIYRGKKLPLDLKQQNVILCFVP